MTGCLLSPPGLVPQRQRCLEELKEWSWDRRRDDLGVEMVRRIEKREMMPEMGEGGTKRRKVLYPSSQSLLRSRAAEKTEKAAGSGR